MDLDVAVHRRVGILQTQVAFTTAKERDEDLPEVFADLVERRVEQFTRRCVDLAEQKTRLTASSGTAVSMALQWFISLAKERRPRCVGII